MSAWPNVSPYEHAVDQTANQGGLWFNQTTDGGRHYLFSLEYLNTQARQPERDLIGARHVVP